MKLPNFLSRFGRKKTEPTSKIRETERTIFGGDAVESAHKFFESNTHIFGEIHIDDLGDREIIELGKLSELMVLNKQGGHTAEFASSVEKFNTLLSRASQRLGKKFKPIQTK